LHRLLKKAGARAGVLITTDESHGQGGGAHKRSGRTLVAKQLIKKLDQLAAEIMKVLKQGAGPGASPLTS
jgi:hypothetical protein